MISFFFSLVASYNIWRGDCQAILDTYEYNLTKFINSSVVHEAGDIVYYVRVCPDFTQGDTFDTFLLRCKKGTSSCNYLITQNSLDYKPRNPMNFSEGLIYFADSEPFSDDGGKTYKTLDLQFDLICDPTVTTSDIQDILFDIKIDESQTGSFIARVRTDAACPVKVPSPTPTPAYDIDCTYVDRIDNNLTYGLDGDLYSLNGGPFGAKVEVDVNGTKRILYYQACERMQCPPAYTCNDDGYSSAWLCTHDTHLCYSYGVITSNDFMPIDSSDLTKGMELTINNPINNNHTKLILTCESSSQYPEGHIHFAPAGYIEENTLHISGAANELCIRRIPTSTPQPRGACQFESLTINDVSISIDLAQLNRGNIGYAKDVQVTGIRDHPKAVLRYQPCGSMICPPDTFCFGDEDAEIWLCYDDDGVKTCDGYGLYKNNVSLALFIDGDLSSGINAKYKGDMKRQADIVLQCNKNLPPHTVELPDTISVSGRILNAFMESRDVCPSVPEEEKSGKSSGGAIFLIIVSVSIVSYISIGLLVTFIKTGKIQFPNEKFWIVFGECIVIAVTYIVKCGRSGPAAFQSKYDQI